MGPIMGGLLEFNEASYLTFFAVLMRYSTLLVILPIFGDRLVPVPVKLLLSLTVTFVLYPVLKETGAIHEQEALKWGASLGGLVGTIALEVLFGLTLGYVGRLVFDAIQIGGEIIGNFMGFASASQYDPQQESQSQVISKIQLNLAMILFLILNGHHVTLQGALKSYEIVPLGGAKFGESLMRELIQLTGWVLTIGLQLAAPIALSLFMINIVYGVISKAIPQFNVLVLSFSVSALIGLFILMAGLPEFFDVTSGMFANLDRQFNAVMVAMGR